MRAVYCVRLSLLIAASGLLSACPTIPPAALQQSPVAPVQPNFNVNGKIGVQYQGKGYSGSFTWQHQVERDEVALFSPLGSQVAQIQRDAQGATLVDSESRIYKAASIEELTQSVLGWTLPIAGLQYWVQGHPSPTSTALRQQDPQNQRLQQLQQEGWQIDYQQYQDYQTFALPSKMRLDRPELTLKLILQEWQ